MRNESPRQNKAVKSHTHTESHQKLHFHVPHVLGLLQQFIALLAQHDATTTQSRLELQWVVYAAVGERTKKRKKKNKTGLHRERHLLQKGKRTRRITRRRREGNKTESDINEGWFWVEEVERRWREERDQTCSCTQKGQNGKEEARLVWESKA